MVLRWVDAGQPDGDLNTRFDRVSQVVGGILDVNGFPGFASNAEAAAVEMDDELQRVLELAEEIVAGKHGAEVMVQRGADASKAGHVASQWVAVFERLGLIDVRQQQDATAKSKSSRVGKLFSSYIDRRLTVDSGSQRHSVTIRKRSGSSGNKTFYFAEVEVIEDAAGGQAEGDAQHQAAAAAACSAAEVTAGVADAYTPTATPFIPLRAATRLPRRRQALRRAGCVQPQPPRTPRPQRSSTMTSEGGHAPSMLTTVLTRLKALSRKGLRHPS